MKGIDVRDGVQEIASRVSALGIPILPLAELVARGFLHDAGDGRRRMLGAVSRCVDGFAETTL